MRKTLSLVVCILISLLSFGQSEIVYQKYGIEFENSSSKRIWHKELSIVNEGRCCYVLSEAYGVKFKIRFLKSLYGEYVYVGSGRIGHFSYSKVIFDI